MRYVISVRRCRDAEMIGPVCDILTDEAPIYEAIHRMRINSRIHNEVDISDEELSKILDTLSGFGKDCFCEDEDADAC